MTSDDEGTGSISGTDYTSAGSLASNNRHKIVGDHQSAAAAAFNAAIVAPPRKNESDEVLTGCASETQRLFWLHSHMNEGSRWPPTICASGLISGGNPRRTWQMQA